MRLLLCLLTLLCALSCSANEADHSYINQEIGLKLTYPASWVAVKESQLHAASAHAPLPQGEASAKEMQKVIPLIAFAIMEPMSSNGTNHNPSFIVMLSPASEKDCEYINSATFSGAEAKNYSASLPGSSFSPTHMPHASRINGYTISIPLKDRVVKQQRFFYCENRKYIILQGTSSSPAGEAALGKVISSIIVNGP